MHYISAVLFALSANMDNAAIGLAYGIKGVRIRRRSNLLIAFITSIGTLVSMGAGGALTSFIPHKIAANIGCGVLIVMGLWFVLTSLHKRLRASSNGAATSGAAAPEPHKKSNNARLELGMGIGIDPSGTAVASTTSIPDESFISLRESVLLALALMVNNLGFGVGARIAGLPILITSGCTLVCSMFLLSGGVFLGKHFGNTFLGRYTDLISGCIIIALGVYEFLV